ncbi:bifunctional endo-1,4-beta-xylanase XylA-like [Salvia splendens]|uniref:bifunctional endo-1,4-beta-xylanase XylA-like n=1 Tax=Salvia splendens TaxID=180675 RepID=UPI001C268179|nr:bifunctional endo-1,4-beta-xylanase XylA-like [Salvia splendens]
MRRGSANALREQDDERFEARIDRLEKALLSAIEKANPPASREKEKTPGPGEAPTQQYYGPQEGDYHAQVNSMGSWNQGKQKDAPWQTHPNFRWSDNDPTQPPPQQNTQCTHQPERQTNWSGRNQEGQNNWNNRYHSDHSNWGNRNQNHQRSSYVPPQQRNYPGNYQNSQPYYQENQGLGNLFNNSSGGQENFRQNQGSVPNLGSGPNPSQLNPGSGPNLVHDLVSSQQHMQNNMQSNINVVHKLRTLSWSRRQRWTCWQSNCPRSQTP